MYVQKIENTLKQMETVIARNNGDFFELFDMAFQNIRENLAMLQEIENNLSVGDVSNG